MMLKRTVFTLLTLKVLVATINAQWEGMGDIGSARYELALLPPCPTIRVLSYSICQRSTHSSFQMNMQKFSTLRVKLVYNLLNLIIISTVSLACENVNTITTAFACNQLYIFITYSK